MKQNSYLIGAPIFAQNLDLDPLLAPLGQLAAVVAILQQNHPIKTLLEEIRQEYISILVAMRQMRLAFNVVVGDRNMLDLVAQLAISRLKIRYTQFGLDYPMQLLAYPRDFAVTLPDRVLISPYMQTLREERNGYKIITSPFGEGGSVLYRKDIAVIPDRVVHVDGKNSRKPTMTDTAALEDGGLRTIQFPCPSLCALKRGENRLEYTSYNDHLDRVACLVEAKDGSLHLIVDHDLVTTAVIRESDSQGKMNCRHRNVEETIHLLETRCQPFGVTVHRAPKCSIPYPLNLLQTYDGRILMTGGAPEVKKMVADVTKQQVHTTGRPIKFLPTFKFAGIRCLINETPFMLLQ